MSAGKDVWGDRAAAGPPQPFFQSRWVDAPAFVGELGPEAGLPAGFRAAGVACGIKPSGNPDVALLVCDSRSPVSAARFADTVALFQALGGGWWNRGNAAGAELAATK